MLTMWPLFSAIIEGKNAFVVLKKTLLPSACENVAPYTRVVVSESIIEIIRDVSTIRDRPKR